MQKIKNALDTYRGLNKNIYIIFIAQIINSMGAFVAPFLTMFLTQKLGLPASEAGSYVTIAAIANVPGMFAGAKLADKFGRKKLYITSTVLMASMLIPPAFLGESKLVIYFLIAMAFFNGAVNPSFTAMISDLTRGEERKKAYSLQYLGWNTGYAVGPMIAGFLFNNYLPLLFLGDAATAFIAITLIAIYVPETKELAEKIPDEELPALERSEKGSLFRVLLKRPSIIVFGFIMFFYRIVYAQRSFALPIQLNEIFGTRGPSIYGMNMSFNAFIVVIFTIFVTGLTLKFKPIFNIIMGGILFAIGFGMIRFVNSFPILLFSTFIWTIGEILEATNINVYIAAHAPVNYRARFNSIFMFISGAGFAFAPKLGGLFLNYFSLGNIWLASFFIMLLATFSLYIFYILLEKN